MTNGSLFTALGAAGLALVVACSKAGPETQPALDGAAAGEDDAGDGGGGATALPPREARFTEAGMLAEAARFLDDRAFRRQALEASLVNPANSYSRHRLEHYGLERRGWELLPEWNPRSTPITREVTAKLRAGAPLSIAPDAAPLWNGERPKTLAAWIALGRQAFFAYPLRSDAYVAWALARADVAEKNALRSDGEGVYPGVRVFADVDGRAKLGITCALCHTSVDGKGRVVVGEARRALDYGAIRLAYHADTKTAVAPDLARRMKTWGPGRADVTEDDDEDPVAIPDLWGLRHQTFLTQAGTIKNDGPSALAIRQETQLLDSNHQKIRPPRVIAYAIAMFLYALEPPASSPIEAPARGKALFEERCAKCHANDVLGGPPVAAAKVGTNDALANGAARGTGKYRPPALVRVARAAPYFHDGSVPTLEDVLSPSRLEASYAKSPIGRGPVPGHSFGTDLPARDRAALVAFLRTL